MKRLFAIVLLLNFVALASSEANNNVVFKDLSRKTIDLFVAGNPNISNNQVIPFENEFETFIKQLASKRKKYKHESKFLEYVFYKTHRKFLKNYKLYSSFADLIVKNNYDCVTGTALYALILERLNIKYTIKEFDYHVLLIAKADSGEVLFESTDPLNGFVKDKSEIKKRVQFYEKQGEENPSTLQIYSVNNNIDIQQLAGLQFYNMAIKSYGNDDYVQAIKSLELGITHYDSNRFQEFLGIVLDNLEDSSIVTTKEINHYLNKYRQNTFAKN